MKNLLLVMETAGAFGSPLWMITWDRIDLFLPELRQEVSRSKTPVARITYDTLPETSSPETSVPQTSFAEASNPATVPESTVQGVQQAVAEVDPELVSEAGPESVSAAVSETVPEAVPEAVPEVISEAVS